MASRRLRAVGVAVGVLAGSIPNAVRAQPNQRAMYVSVLDKAGVPVADLGPTDFEIREDNVMREVLQAVPATAPMQIAVLVDNSQASSEFVRDYRAALPGFMNALTDGEPGAKNEVTLIGVAERPTILTGYTSSRTALTTGIGRIFAMPDSGAYLLDGIMEISRGLRKRRAERPVIVVISTEGVELSGRHFETALEPLRASGATLHAVLLGRPMNASTDRAIALLKGTQETGGRHDMLLVSSALTSRLQELAAELTSQYLVTYGRPQTLLPPDRITVKATRPDLIARGKVTVEPARASGEGR